MPVLCEGMGTRSCLEFPDATAKPAPGQTGHAWTQKLRKVQASSLMRADQLHTRPDQPTLQMRCKQAAKCGAARVRHPAAAQQPMTACVRASRLCTVPHSMHHYALQAVAATPADSTPHHPAPLPLSSTRCMEHAHQHTPHDRITPKTRTHTVQSPHTPTQAG